MAPLLMAAVCCAPVATAQMANETEIKLRAGGFGEGKRDLGLNDGRESSEFFGEIHGSLFTRYDTDISSKLRVQAFYSTGEVFLNTDDTPQPSDRYIALREAWLDFGALTSFPGEVLRIGRQRIREDDGLWYDDDAVGAKWVFDTTLLNAKLGVAQQLEGFRTDDAGLDRDQEDRLYVFGSLGTQFSPGHFAGLRVAHAQDRFDLEDDAGRAPEEQRDRERDFTWVGAHLHSGYFDEQIIRHVAYWAELAAVTGEQRTVERPAPGTGGAPTFARQDVRGLGGDVAIRIRPSLRTPFQFGAAHASGSGGGDADESDRYEQTGLHSNRSRFTGTRTQLQRFNGAAQFNLTNLQATSVFVAIPGARTDASLIAHRFRRDSASGGVSADGLRANPTTPDKDLGTGYDLVISRYFDGFSRVVLRDDGPSGVLRLRASLFEPGDAYGADAESTYRVIAETGWRL